VTTPPRPEGMKITLSATSTVDAHVGAGCGMRNMGTGNLVGHLRVMPLARWISLVCICGRVGLCHVLFIVHGFRFLSIVCLAGRGAWTIRCTWPGVIKARFNVGTCPDLWFFHPRGWRRGVVWCDQQQTTGNAEICGYRLVPPWRRGCVISRLPTADLRKCRSWQLRIHAASKGAPRPYGHDSRPMGGGREARVAQAHRQRAQMAQDSSKPEDVCIP